jgi:hypothetical protein
MRTIAVPSGHSSGMRRGGLGNEGVAADDPSGSERSMELSKSFGTPSDLER